MGSRPGPETIAAMLPSEKHALDRLQAIIKQAQAERNRLLHKIQGRAAARRKADASRAAKLDTKQ